MALFGWKLNGFILFHIHFGSHLDDHRYMIILEKSYFEFTGKVTLWIIDGHPGEHELIGDPEKKMVF